MSEEKIQEIDKREFLRKNGWDIAHDGSCFHKDKTRAKNTEIYNVEKAFLSEIEAQCNKKEG